jgi:hypothetical protein
MNRLDFLFNCGPSGRPIPLRLARYISQNPCPTLPHDLPTARLLSPCHRSAGIPDRQLHACSQERNSGPQNARSNLPGVDAYNGNDSVAHACKGGADDFGSLRPHSPPMCAYHLCRTAGLFRNTAWRRQDTSRCDDQAVCWCHFDSRRLRTDARPAAERLATSGGGLGQRQAIAKAFLPLRLTSYMAMSAL